MASEVREVVPVTSTSDRYTSIIEPVTNTLGSIHSQRAYARAIREYLTWHEATMPTLPLSRISVSTYLAYLRDTVGLSASTINLRMAAIRKLAEEALANGLIDDVAANGIRGLHGVKQYGQRSGNWLPKDVAQRLLNAPDVSTLRGLRDRALLAVLLGAGVRRAEAVHLTVDQIQQRDGRWVLIDLEGKGKRIRSVPITAWVKVAIDAWLSAANIKGGYVFKPLHKNDTLASWEPLHPQTVYDVLAGYVEQLQIPNFAPHDARRTFAMLALQGGSTLQQIQYSLGHASVVTTEKYVGNQQDFVDAPSDHVGLRIE
ncbi:MAG: tyrosine-type recombinase/integrase [Ktedonobacterales bacterium]